MRISFLATDNLRGNIYIDRKPSPYKYRYLLGVLSIKYVNICIGTLRINTNVSSGIENIIKSHMAKLRRNKFSKI